ncbi:MAG: hypothetical protein NW207_03780 [Cytophagales bacterium]|nr:hypothetical protein [Cytophagales bacterium]
MATYTVVISTPESEKDFADFLSTHTDVEATPTEPIQYDPNIYDAEGNFKWISLATPGLPVPDEYMAWRIEQAQKSLAEGKGITFEQLKENLAKRRKEVFNR